MDSKKSALDVWRAEQEEKKRNREAKFAKDLLKSKVEEARLVREQKHKAIKFEEETMKSGIESPDYEDKIASARS